MIVIIKHIWTRMRVVLKINKLCFDVSTSNTNVSQLYILFKSKFVQIKTIPTESSLQYVFHDIRILRTESFNDVTVDTGHWKLYKVLE